MWVEYQLTTFSVYLWKGSIQLPFAFIDANNSPSVAMVILWVIATIVILFLYNNEDSYVNRNQATLLEETDLRKWSTLIC